MQIILNANETMEERISKLVAAFDLVDNIAPIAYWYEHLHENGRIKDIHFSQRMREMLGYKSVEEFPDALNTLMTFTHPEDVHIMLDNAIAAGTGKIDKYDVQYRIRRASGDYMWCNATGQLVKDHNGTTVGMYGSFIDISEKKALEQERINQIESDAINKALADNNASILALEDHFESMYDVELETGRYSVFIKGETYDKEIKDKLKEIKEYYSDLRQNIDMVVYPEDRERLHYVLSKEGIIKGLADKDHFDYYYRVMANNKPVWFKIRVVYKNAEKKDVIIGVFNAEAEVTARQKEEQQRRTLINQMAGDNAVLIVDCVNDARKTVQDTEYADIYNDANSYSHEMNRYIDTSVEADYRELLRTASEPGYMLEHTKDNKEYSLRYRDIAGDVPVYFEMRVKRLSDTEVLQSFSNIDNRVAHEMVRKAITENCYGIYVVDLNNGIAKVVKHSDILSGIVDWSVVSYSQLIGPYIAGMSAKAKQSWEGLESVEGIRQFLKGEDMRSIVYESPYGENRLDRVTWFVVDRVDGEVNLACATFAELDEEQTDKEKLNEQIAEQKTKIEEALHVANEANMSNKLVLSFVNGIKWTYKIGENDEVTDVAYDDEAFGKFDFNHPGDPLAWTRLIHPEDRERVLEIFQKALNDRTGKEQIDFAYRLQGIDGNYQWSKVTGRVIINEDGTRELTGITLDVTEQMEKEREQQRQLQEQLALSDGLAREYHTVWLVDGFGEHRLHLFRSTGKKTVRRAVQRGLDEPTYDGTMVKYVMDSVHEDDRARVLEASRFETVQRETPDVGVYTVSYKRYCDDEGNIDFHQMCFAKAVAEDGTVNFILAFRDADKELREQMAQQKQLADALAMAESANRAKTIFLNNMSHDIRTPMNAIIGYTGLAAGHIDNKEQVRDYLSKIGQSSDHLLSLINDVLDMSRIESGKMNLDEKPENLSDIIHTLRDIVQADVRAKQLDFYVDAVDVNDEDIVCDKLRLNQVLLNILSNAIKYTPAGGTIALRVKETAVKPNGYATYGFCIKDNGMGMDKEFLETIFDPFTRVKSSTVSGIQGTGLGMAITKNIVDMMGGSIVVRSEPNLGTEVNMKFDFRLQSTPQEPIVIAELTGVRGLVVDDDSNTCMSIANMLRDIGMRPEWCTSGREAILRAGEGYRIGDLFKVYIIDWMMPDMNGIETTRRIRKVVGDDIPIIIITAYDWSDIEEEAKEAGVTAFVSKPMFPSDLHRVLNKCLGKEEEKAEAPVAEYDFLGKKILLVEDNELNREIAVALLEESGFKVSCAEDGDIAVEKMKAAKAGDYDLVLMDIQMPRMDGMEATRQIRALGTEISKIPIIAMTANAFEEDRKAALEAGMNEHIAKPIDVGLLKATLAKFL